MTVIIIYDTLSGKKKEFSPIDKDRVCMFVCGPTVYDHAHLGHARCFVFFDVVTNHLRKKFDVFYVQNITDIAKKIEKKAAERNVTPRELSNEFIASFMTDMRALRVNGVSRYALTSDYIEEIQNQVKRLLERGYAYQTEEGVLFDVTRFEDYGRFVEPDRRFLLVDTDKGVTRRDRRDFFLWRTNLESMVLSWDSPWGRGIPGWHVEDTAITEKHFGSRYDIHGGGIDLIHPHHEAERAQMESLSGENPMVNYWMHVGFLTVDGKKMSKSKGNCIYIKNALERYSINCLRAFLLSQPYRSVLNYSEKDIGKADLIIGLLNGTISQLREATCRMHLEEADFDEVYREFNRVMDDDFDTPSAVHLMSDYLRQVAAGLRSVSRDKAAEQLRSIYEMTSILGIKV